MLRTTVTGSHSIRSYCSNAMVKARNKLSNLGKGNISLVLNDTGIVNITIDQENKKNAISGKMMVDLENAVNKLEKWSDGKAILLHGKGDFFCSGSDLTTIENITNREDGYLMSAYMQNVTSRLAQLPLVSFSLIHGGALGGGAELATCTDFRIFTYNAVISFLAAKMGLSTGWGGGTRLTKLVGQKPALHLLLSCSKINHEDALKLGLGDFIVKSENRIENATELISKLVQYDKDIVHAAKSVVLGATSLGYEDSLENERKNFLNLLGGPANLKVLQLAIKRR